MGAFLFLAERQGFEPWNTCEDVTGIPGKDEEDPTDPDRLRDNDLATRDESKKF